MSTSRRPVLYVLSAVFLLAIVALAAFLLTPAPETDSSVGSEAAAGPTAATASPVSTDPGSPAGENHLEPGPGDPVATDPVPEEGTALAEAVVLTYADFDVRSGVEVGGYVTGLIEDGGTCRVTLSQGSRQVSAEVPGAADASTTSCGGLVVAPDDLTEGAWTVELSYESGETLLVSAPATVQVSA